jgi:hypothetical protein
MAMKVHFQLTAKDESLESLPSAGFSDIQSDKRLKNFI